LKHAHSEVTNGGDDDDDDDVGLLSFFFPFGTRKCGEKQEVPKHVRAG
jgi:hypothetical protein